MIISERGSIPGFRKLHNWKCLFTYEGRATESQHHVSMSPRVWKVLLLERRVEIQQRSWLKVLCQYCRSMSSSWTSLGALSTLQVKGEDIRCISSSIFLRFSNRLENSPCNAPNMDEYLRRWSADGVTSFRVCMWVSVFLSSWLERNHLCHESLHQAVHFMNKKALALQLVVQLIHQCSHINSKCYHPVLIWELSEVFAFLLTKLSNLCFQVLNSF